MTVRCTGRRRWHRPVQPHEPQKLYLAGQQSGKALPEKGFGTAQRPIGRKLDQSVAVCRGCQDSGRQASWRLSKPCRSRVSSELVKGSGLGMVLIGCRDVQVNVTE